jgi:hypothetical protein
MSAQNSALSNPVVFSRWRHEYRLSLGLLVAGIALVVGVVIASVWAGASGHPASSFWDGLTHQIAGTGGFMLILLAGTVAYYHRAFLQRNPPGP